MSYTSTPDWWDKIHFILKKNNVENLFLFFFSFNIVWYSFFNGKFSVGNFCVFTGNYIRHDLNLPKTLPVRKGGPQDYKLDSPLTVQGHFQARTVGEYLLFLLVYIYLSMLVGKSSPNINFFLMAVFFSQGIFVAFIMHNLWSLNCWTSMDYCKCCYDLDLTH